MLVLNVHWWHALVSVGGLLSNWPPALKWYVPRLVVKNEYQTDTVLREDYVLKIYTPPR